MSLYIVIPRTNLMVLWEGRTSVAGNVGGTTVVDAALVGLDIPPGAFLIVYTDNILLQSYRQIDSFDAVSTVTVTRAFAAQIPAGTAYAIVVGDAEITSGPTGTLKEQVSPQVGVNAIAGGETNVLNLAVANTRYLIRSLRLKSVDPGANNVTVRLYELVNGVSLVVDTFSITTLNFATYFSLMDMFGLTHLAGDNLRVTVQATAGGPYAVTGQYSYAQTNP